MDISFHTPQDAQEAFYTAFQGKDIAAMRKVWLDADHVECIHPMGVRLLGYADVVESWQQIFGGESNMQFELVDINHTQSCDLSVHILHEKITTGKNPNKQTTVITTNIYQKTEQGWCMVLHHASLSPSAASAGEVGASETIH